MVWDLLDDGIILSISESDCSPTGPVSVVARLAIFWTESVGSIVEAILFEVLCFLSLFLFSKTFSVPGLFQLRENETEDITCFLLQRPRSDKKLDEALEVEKEKHRLSPFPSFYLPSALSSSNLLT